MLLPWLPPHEAGLFLSELNEFEFVPEVTIPLAVGTGVEGPPVFFGSPGGGREPGTALPALAPVP